MTFGTTLVITNIAEIRSMLFFGVYVFCKILWQFLPKIELGLHRNPSLLENVSTLENTDGKLTSNVGEKKYIYISLKIHSL